MLVFTNFCTVHNKDLDIIFAVCDDKAGTGGELKIIDKLTGDKKVIDSAQYIVLELIRFFQSNETYLKCIYTSSTPFWLFHDIAHALYTSHLFVPDSKTITQEDEEAMYVKGIELARQCKLPEQYISTIPELIKVGLIDGSIRRDSSL